MKKKYEVVKRDEEEKEIVIGKRKSKVELFREKYGKNILLALFLLCIIVLVLGIYFTVSNFGDSAEPKYKDLEVDFDDDKVVVDDETPITDNNVNEVFTQVINNSLKTKGEIMIDNFIDKKDLKIYFFSDGSVLMKKETKIYRVSAKKDGSYGVSEKGDIDTDVYSRELTITNTKNYQDGIIEYYSDGSALIVSEKDTIYVRNSNDIKDNYISISEVSYINKSSKVGSYQVTYYHNGMINITGQGKDYVIHKEEDFNIDGSNLTFKYGNEAKLVKEVVYNNRTKIRYYDDGSAIIFKNNNYVSVGSGNAIVISNNDFKEIDDSYYVNNVKTKDVSSGKVYYYDNGSAIIRYNSNEVIYVANSEDIRYEDGHISSIDGDTTVISDIKENNGKKIEYFNDVVHVITSDGKEIIAGKNDVSDEEAISKGTDRKSGTYTISNNDDKVIHYRLVLEKSDKTTVNPSFVNYIMDVNGTTKKGIITDNIWNVGSQLYGGKTLGKESYILSEGTIDPVDRIAINLMLYYNYENMTNDMMDKWFIGTFKVYGWEEE